MAERTTWQQRARRTSGPSHYQFGDATRMVFNGPWRQRAGRTEGPDHYQFGDVARMVINRTFNRDSPEEAQPILGDEVNSPSGSTTLDASVQASQMEAIVHAADEDTVVEVEHRGAGLGPAPMRPLLPRRVHRPLAPLVRRGQFGPTPWP